MTSKYSPILWWPPKNIHIIFIPQKIFIFLKTPKNIEIQNFEPPKNGQSLRMYENIRVPPWVWSFSTEQVTLKAIKTTPLASLALSFRTASKESGKISEFFRESLAVTVKQLTHSIIDLIAILYMTQKLSDDQALQTTPRHREKEPHDNNNHQPSGRQLK